MKQDYEVTLHCFQEHVYHIQDVNSSEEAESIAEGLLKDGEQGTVEIVDSFVASSMPATNQEGSD